MTHDLSPMTSPRFIALTIAYDGAQFCGSQRQVNGPSVQGEVERALEVVLKHPAPISMAGRTDAGVHALGQCARFGTPNPMPAEKFVPALNRVLTKAVRVLNSREVNEEFHPRFSAKSRVYRYWIENAPVPSPLLRGIAGHVVKPLNADAMRCTMVLLIVIGAVSITVWLVRQRFGRSTEL